MQKLCGDILAEAEREEKKQEGGKVERDAKVKQEVADAAPGARLKEVKQEQEEDAGSDTNDDRPRGRQRGPDMRQVVPRRRRRTRSRSVAAERAREGAAAPVEIDLTLHMSPKWIAMLTEEQNIRLLNIVKVHEAQVISVNYRPGAASGARQGPAQLQESLTEQLPGFVNPIPPAEEFVAGMDHKNSNPAHADKKWDVVRALQSSMMHYST